MRKGFVLFILIAYLLTACDVIGGDTGPSDSAVLESNTWVLISYGEEGFHSQAASACFCHSGW